MLCHIIRGVMGLASIGPDTERFSGVFVQDGTNAQASLIAELSPSGTLTVQSSAAVDVSIDVVGWFSMPTRTYTYQYGPSGLRSAKELEGVGGWRKEFTWTATGGLPLLLAEHEGSAASYLVYGPDGTPIYQVGRDGQPIYLHQDHLGSTRVTTTATGHLRGTMTYDAHGEITSNTNNPWLEQSLLGFNGQYHDPETGYIYLRARHYDPTTGQFTSLDPLVAVTEEPYGYTYGNPANGTDPTGLWGVRLGPVKIGSDGCVLGANPNGSCRGSDVKNVVKTVNQASGVVAAGAGACTATGALSVVGAPVAGACGAVAGASAAVYLGTGVALTTIGDKSLLSLAVDVGLVALSATAAKAAAKAAQYAVRHQRIGGILGYLGIPTLRQWAGEIGEVFAWHAKGWIDLSPYIWTFGDWLDLGDDRAC